MIAITKFPLLLFCMSPFLAQETSEYQTSAGSTAVGVVGGVIGLVVGVLIIAALWKVFSKAGQPSWAAIIPIYNIYVMCKVAGRHGWWLLLMLIPLVNFIVGIILCIDIAKIFGKGTGFGSATYQDAAAA